MNPNSQRFRNLFDNNIDRWPDFLGVLMLLFGLTGFISEYLGWSFLYIPLLSNLLLRVWPELFGIGIAVLIIDNANEVIRKREEKKRLILQMGSPDNAFAIEALRQLRARGWLYDGSLRRAYLVEANLRGADFTASNLEVVNLTGANLSYARLILTKMGGAILDGAILEGAEILSVDFKDSTITTEQLANAIILDGKPMPDGIPRGIGTIMPNGTVINPKNFEEKQEEQWQQE